MPERNRMLGEILIEMGCLTPDSLAEALAQQQDRNERLGEILVGLGVQNAYSRNRKLQGFFQIAVGPDSIGIVIKPTIGFNYSLSDNLAIYGHVGKTLSLHELDLYPKKRRFSSYSAGLGLTYRFSLL